MNNTDIIEVQYFYKKKIIRDFITLYSKTTWRQLIGSLLEYAILIMKKNNIDYNILSAEEIISMVDQLKVDMSYLERKTVKRSDSKSSNIKNSLSKNSLKSSKISNNSKQSFNNTIQIKAVSNSSIDVKNNKTANLKYNFSPDYKSTSNSPNFSNINVNSNLKKKVEHTEHNHNYNRNNKTTISKSSSKTKSTLNNIKKISSNTSLKSTSKSKSKTQFIALETKQLEKIKQKRALQEQQSAISSLIEDSSSAAQKYKQQVNNKVESKIKNEIQLHKKIHNVYNNNKIPTENREETDDIHYDDLEGGLESSNFSKKILDNKLNTISKLPNNLNKFEVNRNINNISPIVYNQMNFVEVKDIGRNNSKMNYYSSKIETLKSDDYKDNNKCHETDQYIDHNDIVYDYNNQLNKNEEKTYSAYSGDYNDCNFPLQSHGNREKEIKTKETKGLSQLKEKLNKIGQASNIKSNLDQLNEMFNNFDNKISNYDLDNSN